MTKIKIDRSMSVSSVSVVLKNERIFAAGHKRKTGWHFTYGMRDSIVGGVIQKKTITGVKAQLRMVIRNIDKAF